MDRRFHFISGLPRSGSTLLGALLRQNPAFHAGMSSPLGAIVARVQAAMGPKNEFAALIDDTHRRNILSATVHAFYKGVEVTKTVFDTNRMWCSRLPLIASLFPEATIVVCVRDLAWIMDSFERAVRRNPLGQPTMFRPEDAATVYTRAAALAAPRGTVGFAWNATREAFYGDEAERLIVIDYEALTREPRRVLQTIYDRLGLPAFAHDTENVVYDEGRAFDAGLGLPGLHKVGRAVAFRERPTILPPDLFAAFSGGSYWRDPSFNPRAVTVILPSH